MKARMVLAVLAAAVTVSACGAAPAVSVAAHPRPATARLSNQAAAQREAERLMQTLTLPPGAQRLAGPPRGLDGPFVGIPAASSIARRASTWAVPMSFDTTLAWFGTHPPAGNPRLAVSENSSGPGQGHAGFGYEGHQSSAWSSSQLDVSLLGTDGAKTYVRGDAVVVWLDPRPQRVTYDPKRPSLHFAATGACPPSDAGYPTVRNDVRGLDRALLPAGEPVAGLICRYDGMNGSPFRLVKTTRLDAAAATHLAAAIRAVPLSHVDGGTTSCPMDDGSMAYLAFDYADGTSVDLDAALGGCATIGNGRIFTGAWLDSLLGK